MKYKLIKEYPNSPSLGTVFTPYGDAAIEAFNDYPEFWEKIEEKDYEILKEEYIPGMRIPTLMLTDKEIADQVRRSKKITSVKRLSDGVIFSIGDRVHNPKTFTQDFIIEEFYLNADSSHMLAGKGHISINKIEHAKSTFTIKINDSFCEWEYGFGITKVSINDFVDAIEKQMNISRLSSKLIWKRST